MNVGHYQGCFCLQGAAQQHQSTIVACGAMFSGAVDHVLQRGEAPNFCLSEKCFLSESFLSKCQT